MIGGPERAAEPHSVAAGSGQNVIAAVERALGVRFKCTGKGSDVSRPSFSAAC
jgi:hypothetical protein